LVPDIRTHNCLLLGTLAHLPGEGDSTNWSIQLRNEYWDWEAAKEEAAVAGQCELFASALGGIGLQRVLNTALLAALLADEQRTSVVGYMLLDAESPEMRTSQPASRADPSRSERASPTSTVRGSA